MGNNKLEKILMQGIHGTVETLPEERALFLSTISERIYLALTNKQVIHKGIYKEAVDIMHSEKNIHLYINGELSYSNYSNYIKEATKHKVAFTIVNDGHDTPIGLVFACDTAINHSGKFNFFIEDEIFEKDMGEF
ncbi:hypothetical protein BKP35_03650 [Anaerobacillus arseniciselenatis]|uniref:DUF1694 domain-containing protein n=1 Tax=Anaerobacillus arseniciselenatis TaxID=85682 RepID=A0A1S2LUR3_9BACI|nr:YueI family protein [Anaerobacillus arseniciselenatis]OIJ16086.1 hypothetical protein BKP35_03650 [Anaerobacillus arseniciselenatis]